MDSEKETSYGIIPLRKVEGLWQVLLVKHRAGHWAFPKGHPEKQETPFESAKRELFEETGLVVKQLLRDTPLRESYRFERQGRIMDKRVVYFLANVEGEPTIQAAELTDSRWVSIAEATDLATFPEAKRLCLEIVSFLN